MEKEIKLLEEEIREINKFDEIQMEMDIQSLSRTCSPIFTIICC